MDDKVIDIQQYLKTSSRGPGSAFAVWGGEGEKARFALPVWRAVFLLGGERGGIVSLSQEGGGKPEAFFVLDLGEDPARTEFPSLPVSLLGSQEAPATAPLPGGGAGIFLGEEEGRAWYLTVLGGEDRTSPSGRKWEDLLFLAGECAGLLFFRGLAGEGSEGPED